MAVKVGVYGLGVAVPTKVLSNQDLEKIVNTSDEWIRTRTGIKERRVIEEGKATSDLAVEAAKKALEDAAIHPSDIELLIVATASPDMIWPATACIVAHKLGLRRIPAFDIQAACAGFIFGLSIAEQYISNRNYENVLLIGSDALTRYVNWSDRSTCVLFGDGAGALVLRKSASEYGILATYLATDGAGADLLKIPAGGTLLPASSETIAQDLHYIHMNGNEVFKFAVRAIPEAAYKVLEKAKLTISDIDFFIPHQANVRIIEAAAERLKISKKKIVLNIDKYGNTSTASIPLALNELREKGHLKKGTTLLLVSFGAGFTWGATILKWSRDD
jgi:3-oxoacyl-[acyl-carrier-protein] synthase-3